MVTCHVTVCKVFRKDLGFLEERGNSPLGEAGYNRF